MRLFFLQSTKVVFEGSTTHYSANCFYIVDDPKQVEDFVQRGIAETEADHEARLAREAAEQRLAEEAAAAQAAEETK